MECIELTVENRIIVPFTPSPLNFIPTPSIINFVISKSLFQRFDSISIETYPKIFIKNNNVN